MPTWELLICTKAIRTFFKRLTELFHILGNIEHYFLVNNFHLFFHTAYQGLPANADVFPVVDYLLLCCCYRCCLFCCLSVASLSHTTGNTSAFRLQRGLWARFSYLMITQPDYSRSFLNGKIHETDNSILKRRGGSGSLPFFNGQLRPSSQPRPQGLLVCQYGVGGSKPIRVHVYVHQEMYQSAKVLVRCVSRSSLLPPPYWKTRRTWGRG